jgi:hypothetical protein
MPIRLGPIRIGLSLSIERLPEHGFGERLPDRQENVFDFGQARAPRRTLRTVDPIDERLGHAFDERLNRLDALRNLFLPGHPWLLEKSLALSRCENSQLTAHSIPALANKLQTMSCTRRMQKNGIRLAFAPPSRL